MLTGIHYILTYTCNFECDHCFLYCSPRAHGTFSAGQVDQVLDAASTIGTVEWIFFEGGEPFLYYPLLRHGIQQAAARGFNVGLVTNAYGANSEKDAGLWLKPLADAGLSHLSISNDTYHYGEETENPATIAAKVAKRIGIETASICIEPPTVVQPSAGNEKKGRPVVGGGPKFRGRAVEKLSADLPLRPWREFRRCPFEDLESPSRVHVDPFGHVHLCQGISMGNMWKTPLPDIISSYRPDRHPVCGPLIRGGPAELAEALGVTPAAGYIDACHFCYLIRRAVVDQFPALLAPKQVYGLN